MSNRDSMQDVKLDGRYEQMGLEDADGIHKVNQRNMGINICACILTLGLAIYAIIMYVLTVEDCDLYVVDSDGDDVTPEELGLPWQFRFGISTWMLVFGICTAFFPFCFCTMGTRWSLHITPTQRVCNIILGTVFCLVYIFWFGWFIFGHYLIFSKSKKDWDIVCEMDINTEEYTGHRIWLAGLGAIIWGWVGAIVFLIYCYVVGRWQISG
eukprot:TRINITY_DN66649_c7_g5_i2.p1 TRINITY_DN66649_c7_g5~~TRINITY_DN66649_c7_g5_i2.p1  ORF type:complete len:211 (+),score=2.73 TRINITY_DN66649_c7_g5_i2:18-650(+)